MNEPIIFTNREALWQQLKNEPSRKWDIIVIGGGIIGAGVLREASRLGLSALLIEQNDFASGTSSRSSKMVHGGLRYIAQGDIKLTKHSLQERERLLSEAPGLIYRTKNYFLIKKGQFPGRLIMSLVLKFYDWLAGHKSQRFVKTDELLEYFPDLKIKKLKGACYYSDTGTDDARLVFRVLQEAIQAGGKVLNYVRAENLIKSNENVTGIKLKNISEHGSIKQESLEINAKVIINATGAWADNLRSQMIDEKRIRPLRGSHLIFSHKRFPIDGMLMILHPKDDRPVFVFSWEAATVVGTTDLDHDASLNMEASITTEEVDYLFEILTYHFPEKKLTIKDVIASYAGVRPVMGTDKKKDPSKERRDHAVWSDNGLVTVTGGKLTTFRLIALDALQAAKPWLCTSQLSSTIETEPNKRVFQAIDEKLLSEFSHLDQQWLERLKGRYGNNSKHLLSYAKKSESEFIDNTLFCVAEIRWAAKNESVVHLDDLLLRRTRLGILLKNGGEELFTKIRIICQQELGWDDKKWLEELARYKEILKKYYSLPSV